MIKIKKYKNKRNNWGVSEVLGTVLLLLISVSLFSAVYITFFSIEIKPSIPAVNIVGTVEKNILLLEHRGGESLSLNTEVILRYNGGTMKSILVNNGSYLIDQYKKDGKWNIGERFAYPLSELLNFARFDSINVTVVDVESNSILMTGAVIEPRVADITLQMSVSDDEPAVGDDITVTITVKNNKGPSDAKDISVKYLLPSYLTYINSYSTQGNYNNTSGIWKVGDIDVNFSATLNINVTVSSFSYNPKTTQFALLLDGSGSINESSWNLAIEGISAAIDDEFVFPHDGTVELTIIQFGVNLGNKGEKVCARVEVGPVVVEDDNYQSIVTQISQLTQGEGWTPTAAAIYLAADKLKNSNNFGGSNQNYKQIITLVTDGNANVYSEAGELCGSIWNNKPLGQTAANNARNYLLNTLLMTEDQDEFDVIAVDPGPNHEEIDKEWLCDDIVWPQECYDGEPPPENDIGWPPPGPGWYNYSRDWIEFEIAIKNHFKILFWKIDNSAAVIESAYMDLNTNDNRATISIYPKNSEQT